MIQLVVTLKEQNKAHIHGYRYLCPQKFQLEQFSYNHCFQKSKREDINFLGQAQFYGWFVICMRKRLMDHFEIIPMVWTDASYKLNIAQL